MIKGSAPGAHTLTSRLFLKRFQPPAEQATEDDRETQSLVVALAACPCQTAVESDIKVRVLVARCWRVVGLRTCPCSLARLKEPAEPTLWPP